MYAIRSYYGLQQVAEALQKFPGLLLSGNAIGGVSLNDCVLNAERNAQALLRAGQGTARA